MVGQCQHHLCLFGLDPVQTLTEPFLHLLVPVFKVGNNELVTGEPAGVPKCQSDSVGGREDALARFKVIESKALKASHVIGELAKAPMSPSMKSWDTKPRVRCQEFLRKKIAPSNSPFGCAADVIADSQPLPIEVKKFVHRC